MFLLKLIISKILWYAGWKILRFILFPYKKLFTLSPNIFFLDFYFCICDLFEKIQKIEVVIFKSEKWKIHNLSVYFMTKKENLIPLFVYNNLLLILFQTNLLFKHTQENWKQFKNSSIFEEPKEILIAIR